MSTPKTCPHSSGARAETHFFTGQCGLCERDAEIARLTARVSELAVLLAQSRADLGEMRPAVDAAREKQPKLSNHLLGKIEVCIIENTGDGVLAAYVVKWLGGDGERCLWCGADRMGNDEICPKCQHAVSGMPQRG